MAAIGDSITQAYDDCCSLGPHPQDSWSTGSAYPGNGIYSHYERVVALNGLIFQHSYNDSVPGATVAATKSQAQIAVQQRAQYVTVLIGANDVCTNSISAMTPTPEFQSDFQATVSVLEGGLPPTAHIFVSSIPNIYQLWTVLHDNPNAEAVWSAAQICQSMLSPRDTEAQRQQVLAQEQADNHAMAQVCQQYTNCKWDNDSTFDYQFAADDVSTIDYFHPSQTGQSVLADVTWNASWWSILPPAAAHGYRLVGADGGVFDFGNAAFYGSLPGGQASPASPVVGMASTPDGGGYWLVGADGGVFAFGDAAYDGSLPAEQASPPAPVVGMASTPDGGGYWLVGADGGVFAFGDAAYDGSLPAEQASPPAPVVGMASTPDGGGYWLVGADGGVFAFGDAAYDGSLPGGHASPAAPVVGMASTPDGGGYWLVGADGGVFAFGDAANYGSLPGAHVSPAEPVVGMASTPDGGGYWLVGADGGVFDFGDAAYYGSLPGAHVSPAEPVVGAATAR